jgi:hypothetical protein
MTVMLAGDALARVFALNVSFLSCCPESGLSGYDNIAHVGAGLLPERMTEYLLTLKHMDT